MVYESQISFTLDTVCGWTYLAKKRLDIALEKFRSSPGQENVNFTVKFFPFQLYPDASKEGEDEYEWCKKIHTDGSEEQMKKFTTVMTAYGEPVGINFNFHGTFANSMNAHRMIQYYQEEMGSGTADKIVNSLFAQYFETEAPPSSHDTLVKAAKAAGIDQSKAEAFITDEYEFLPETKMLIREQANNGVDTVPHVVLEGKRRDFTLEGAKEVEDYLKAFEKVVKESK